MDSIEEVANSILDTIKEKSGDFLDDNQAAKDFILERGKRLAKLIIEYKTATNDITKQVKKEQMGVVADSIETELLTVALNGQAESKSVFKAIVNSTFAAIVKILPVVLSAI